MSVKLAGACVFLSLSLSAKYFKSLQVNLVNGSLARGSVDKSLALRRDCCHCKCFVVFVALTVILFHIICLAYECKLRHTIV